MSPARMIGAGCAAIAASILLSFVHPFGNLRAVHSGGAILSGTELPADVRNLLETKCADCHSNATRWPLYSHLAPGSWLVERDVAEGREHLNFSAWEQRDRQGQMDLLARIGSEARSGEMPVKQYLFLHPEARLTDAEKESIYKATKAERKRLGALPTTQ